MGRERDFENIDDVDDLDDGELRRLVRDRLAEHRGLDAADITVTVHDRVVALDGRVGTEGERRVAERVVTDLVGLADVNNNLVVDSLRRAESPRQSMTISRTKTSIQGSCSAIVPCLSVRKQSISKRISTRVSSGRPTWGTQSRTEPRGSRRRLRLRKESRAPRTFPTTTLTGIHIESASATD
jgi:hypothetical protein